MNIQCTSAGKFKLEIIRPDGGRREYDFDNLITDIGLVRMGPSADYLDIVRVGSGSTPPAFSDTQLVSQVAAVAFTTASSVDGASSISPYYGFARRVYNFAAGAAAGNLSEIGVGWSTTGSTLFSRALIRDSMGNPTTITVLSDEILIVTYEHRYYVPETDWTGEVTFTGNIGGTYDVIGRSSSVNLSSATYASQAQVSSPGGNTAWAYSGDIGPITGVPAGAIPSSSVNVTDGTASGTSAAYTLSFGLGVANSVSGIRSVVRRMGNSQFQFQFDPPIMKTSEDTLTLTFSLTWGRR